MTIKIAVRKGDGLLRSIRSDACAVNEEMLEDGRVGFHGRRGSNLGALLAQGLSQDLGGSALIVDPVSVDESGPPARRRRRPLVRRNASTASLR